MDKPSLRKQYQQGAVLLKQFEAIPKKDLLGGKASRYMETMQHISSIQEKIRTILLYTTNTAEEEFAKRIPKVTEKEKLILSEIETVEQLKLEGESTIKHYDDEIEKCTVEYDAITQELGIKRDELRTLISQPGYSSEDASALIATIQKLERKQKGQTTLINKYNGEIEKTNASIQDLGSDLIILQNNLALEKEQKKSFDRNTYEKRLMDIFLARYDSRPKQSYNNYKSLFELFGVEAIVNENELLQEASRGEGKKGRRGKTISKKLTFKKLGGFKEILDSMGIVVQKDNIYEFKDVTYIYIPEFNKGIIISDKKYSATDRECYTHATFIMPGDAKKDQYNKLQFPTPLLAKRIIFTNEDQWKIDVSNWLQEDNHHEGFKTRIFTYNEEKGIRVKGLVDKPNIVGENIVEKETCINIILSHFTNLDDLGHDSYKEFAHTWNMNPDNQYKLKGSLAGLRFVLGGTKPVFTIEYIKALIRQDHNLIKRIESDYEKSKITVYNNKDTYNIMKELVDNNIINPEYVGFYKYTEILVHNIARYIARKHNIVEPTTLKNKWKLLIKHVGLTSMPMKLSVILGGVESADSMYQSLLVKKFIGYIGGKEFTRENEIALQEREIFVLGHLGKPEKNIFKKDQEEGGNSDNKADGEHIHHTEEKERDTAQVYIESDEKPEVVIENITEVPCSKIDYKKEIDSLNPAVKEIIGSFVKKLNKGVMNINNKYVNVKPISPQDQSMIMEFAYIYLKKELKKSCDKPKSYIEDFLRNQSDILVAFNKTGLLKEKQIGIAKFDRFEILLLTNELMYGTTNKWY